jgi:hypothetical protein
MKTPITVRVETELLTRTHYCAQQENRSGANFVGTVLQRQASRKAVSRLTDAA